MGTGWWDFNWIHSHTYPASNKLSQDRREKKQKDGGDVAHVKLCEYCKRNKKQRGKDSCIQVIKRKE